MPNTHAEFVDEATETAMTIGAMAILYALEHVDDFTEFVSKMGDDGMIGHSGVPEGMSAADAMAHDLAVAGKIFIGAPDAYREFIASQN